MHDCPGGRGTTVPERIDSISAITGLDCPVRAADRREGDAAALIADNRKIIAELGLAPNHGLDDIIDSPRCHRSQISARCAAE